MKVNEAAELCCDIEEAIYDVVVQQQQLIKRQQRLAELFHDFAEAIENEED